MTNGRLDGRRRWVAAAAPWVLRALPLAPDPRIGAWAARALQTGLRPGDAPLPVGPDEVLFLYFADRPVEQGVWVAGDWTGWRPEVSLVRVGETPLWAARVRLPGDSWVGYKFIVDGRWLHDPLNPALVGAGLGLTNSLLTLPSFRVPPELEGEEGRVVPSGQVVDLGVIPAPTLPSGRRVRVYLPPGVSTGGSGAARFPTLYVQDGEENISRGRIPRTLDLLIARGFPPVLAVFVDHPGEERHLDYTPYFQGSRVDGYGDFLAHTVVPLVEGRFPARGDRAARVLWGQSFGGTCAFMVGRAHPSVFGRVASQSGVFVWGGVQGVAELYVDPPAPDTRFYLDSTRFGAEPEQSGAMAETLRGLGAQFVYQKRGTNHSYEGWRFWLPDLLRTLL